MQTLHLGLPVDRCLRTLEPDLIERALSQPVVQDLFLTGLGLYPSASHFGTDRAHATDDATLIYCTAGAGWCRVQGNTWTINEGYAVVIPPAIPARSGADPTTSWSLFWLRFHGDRLASYLGMLGTSVEAPVFYAPDTRRISHAFDEIYNHFRGEHPDARLVGMSTALVYLLGLLKCATATPDEDRFSHEEKVRASIEYMREHLADSCSLADLALASLMSVSHYSHLFKAHTNTSPIHYFIRLKMHRACELLETTDLSVGRIAQRVGYADPFHFCRAFKKEFDRSPSQYRNAVRRQGP
jgi:AraC family transcriptional regulator, arabinose operon regulatory protein